MSTEDDTHRVAPFALGHRNWRDRLEVHGLSKDELDEAISQPTVGAAGATVASGDPGADACGAAPGAGSADGHDDDDEPVAGDDPLGLSEEDGAATGGPSAPPTGSLLPEDGPSADVLPIGRPPSRRAVAPPTDGSRRGRARHPSVQGAENTRRGGRSIFAQPPGTRPRRLAAAPTAFAAAGRPRSGTGGTAGTTPRISTRRAPNSVVPPRAPGEGS